jgi:hypothetical protein
MLKYLFNILLSLDQFANALLCGDPDETISSRVGKRHRFFEKIIDTIFFFDKRHCEKSFEGDEGLNAVPSSQRWQIILFWLLIAVFCLL